MAETLTEARRDRAVVPTIVAMIVPMMLAFMSILPGDDAMSAGLTPSRVWEIGLSGVAVAIGVFSRLNGRFHRLPPAALMPPLVVFIFTVWALFTVLWAPLMMIGIGRALQLIMIVFASYFIVSLPQRFPRNGDPNAIVNSVAVGMLITVGILLLANTGLYGTPFPFEGTASDNPLTGSLRPRLFLGVNHPLETAGFLSVTILFVAASTLRRVVKLGAMAGLCAMLIFTDGRTATVATLLGVAVLFYVDLRPSPVKILVALILVVSVAGGLVMLIVFGNVDRFFSSAIGEDVFTLNGRVALWEYGVQAWSEAPVIGVGYYNTRIVLLPAFPFAGHTHQSLIEILLGTGLPGFLLCLLFLFACFHAAARTGDRLLAGLLAITLIDGALNPLLFIPCVGQAVLLLAVMRAYAVGAPRRSPAPVPALGAALPQPG